MLPNSFPKIVGFSLLLAVLLALALIVGLYSLSLSSKPFLGLQRPLKGQGFYAVFTSPLYLSLAALVLLLYVLRHLLRVALFFLKQYLYSSPSYTGNLRYQFPRIDAWLRRMPYSISLSKKQRAFRSRRYYLTFV